MWPDLDAYRHSGHWSDDRNCSTLCAMNYFAQRLQHETDADDVGAALAGGTADFTLIDARSPAAYAAAHLPGAINLPHRALTPEQLPDGPLVVYCWGPGCNAATKACAKITDFGREVKEMLGGFEYFVREGYPVEGTNADHFAKEQRGLVVLPGETMAGCSLPSERSAPSATPMAQAT
jgi:rhodanese-related sulfurtransferase